MSQTNESVKRKAGAARIPRATYRLQFNQEFTFAQAREVAEYLRDLGISDVYASPLFQAAPQSSHGYNVCDFNQLNPALGGRAGFESMSARFRELGLGLLLDLVPNHMATDLSNPWWANVLERGRFSPYADYFDIEWRPSQPSLKDKVLLPLLEDPYAQVLERGALRLACEHGKFAIAYHEHRFPVAPDSVAALLHTAIDAASLDQTRDPFLKGLLNQFNGQPGKPATFDQLHALLARQHYRLAFWRLGAEEINYRRFFDVGELVSLRMERRPVFQATHQLVFDLVNRGHVTGLRIDHPDGLWDPQQYFRRVRVALAALGSIYMVAEKILSGDEALRRDWPVEGTTGYDFLNRVNGLFVDPVHQPDLDRIYRQFTGNPSDFPTMVRQSKQQVLERSFPNDLNRLSQRLRELGANTRYGQDVTDRQWREALAEVLVAFPVYRTYLTDRTEALSPEERRYVEAACSQARTNTRISPAALELLQDLLLLRFPADFNVPARQKARQFVQRFQQMTGPLAAKGIEDTAFYNYNRLLSLNEVGGDADTFGTSVEAFHLANQTQSRHWPHTLLATATHDTKRGEDMRARLNILSELPSEWEAALARWSRFNSGKKQPVEGGAAPHPNDEYLLYQTLIGTWPSTDRSTGADREFPAQEYCGRLTQYMVKALKEAKARTSWTDPKAAYEQAVVRFLETILDRQQSAPFLNDLAEFQRRVAFFGRFNSLSQTLLKMASPGVPDFYQGTELWDLSLVDPDNRRPVDYQLRRSALADLQRQVPSSNVAPPAVLQHLLKTSGSGQIKLYLIWRALELRKRRSALFQEGAYQPVSAAGAKASHVCALIRKLGHQVVLAVVPRLVVTLTQGVERPPLGETVWEGTSLQLPLEGTPPLEFRNVLTGERLAPERVDDRPALRLGSVLSQFPVALLESVPLDVPKGSGRERGS